jgi:NAD(P)-dependent dehydrogenase (short-subunit alcohol dehydrogenase family)
MTEKKDWTVGEWIYKPEEMFSVKDKVTIVTGAASGIGRAIALGFDALGARVVLADINEEGIEEAAKECRGDILKTKLDVTDEKSIQAAIKKTMNKYGRIDVSFNIPGINIRKPALELTYEEYDKVLQINQVGVFKCAREVGKIMCDQKKGSMINMASLLAEGVLPFQVAYASTKGAIRQMTGVLAIEWAPYVRVNAIGPCYIETPLVKQVMTNTKWYESMRKLNIQKRFGKPEEIVGTAVFLASDASSLYTGALLLPDGGMCNFFGWVET